MSKRAKKLSVRQVEPVRSVTIQLPLRMLSALEGARNAFFGLCLGAGREVLGAMMEEDREALCGPKGAHVQDRRAYRAGSAPSEVTLGGRRIAMRRLRARTVEGEELELASFGFASSRDPLDAHTLAAISAGVSTRRYAGTLEVLPAGEEESAVSRSSVSRRFVALSQKQLGAWLSEPLGDKDVRAVMIDGKIFEDHAVLIALGITQSGEKIVLGMREGTTENAVVAHALLSDLIERGLRVDRPMLFVIDGGKGLRKAIRECFGENAIVQRCLEHKRRNVLEHLPKHRHASVGAALRSAWRCPDVRRARRKLERLARSLEVAHTGAAGSLREGMDETLTLQRLGLVEGALARTLRTTNPIENLMGSVERYTRNVRRWRGGAMILRWVGAAVLQAQPRFRRVRGYRELPRLASALKSLKAMDGQEQAA